MDALNVFHYRALLRARSVLGPKWRDQLCEIIESGKMPFALKEQENLLEEIYLELKPEGIHHITLLDILKGAA